MDHGHGGMGDGNPTPTAAAGSHYTHMTFFWGKDSEILFSGWPGSRSGMYALALVLVFALAFLVECLSQVRLVRPGASHAAAVLARTAMHAARVGFAYLVMLAVMSFNTGVLIAAVTGHAVGFLLFGSRAFRRRRCSRRTARDTKSSATFRRWRADFIVD